MNDILDKLNTILQDRKSAAPESSYVANLYHKGLNKILEKVGEEATEVIIAAKDLASNPNTQAVIAETADLWFHSLVLLSHLNIDFNEVLIELDKRFGTSGITEKASRTSKKQS